MARHDDLFLGLTTPTDITALIGQTEDLHLDCKQWPQNESEGLKVLAKCMCGFANSDGGVIVVGLEARSAGKQDPDVIKGAVPVAKVIAVKARIEASIGDLVEPLLRGIQLKAVLDPPNSNTGFILINIPPTDGPPCRSRKDWRFYHRIASGTYLMEHFQIADMFGKRHRPALALFLEHDRVVVEQGRPVRKLIIGIENRGRAVAKYPMISFRKMGLTWYGIDGIGGFGLPLRPTLAGLPTFGGGIDHVIYPNTILKIAILEQYIGRQLRSQDNVVSGALFDEIPFSAQIAADEFPLLEVAKIIPALECLRSELPTWLVGQ